MADSQYRPASIQSRTELSRTVRFQLEWGAGRKLFCATLALLGTTGLIACGEGDKGASGPVVTNPGSSTTSPCEAGQERRCSVDLGSNGTQENCFVGVQTCGDDKKWGPCVDAPAEADSGPTTKALPASAVCTNAAPCVCSDNPCNHTCQAVVDNDPMTPEAGTGTGGSEFEWPTIPALDRLPSDLTQACFIGTECGSNAKCRNVATAPNCGDAFNKCMSTTTVGTPMAAPSQNCDPCVSVVCDFRGSCCSSPCGANAEYDSATGRCYVQASKTGLALDTQQNWLGARWACQSLGKGWDLAYANDATELAYMATQAPEQRHILGTYLSGVPATYNGDCRVMAGSSVSTNASCTDTWNRFLCEGPDAPTEKARCSHNLCEIGGYGLDSYCSDCTRTICADPNLSYCCDETAPFAWDEACRFAVGTHCGVPCGCPAGTTDINGRCYIRRTITSAKWPAARGGCAGYGDLASFNSAEEWQAIRDAGLLSGETWVGLQRNASTNTWSWVDGTPWTDNMFGLVTQGPGSDNSNIGAYAKVVGSDVWVISDGNARSAVLCEAPYTGGTTPTAPAWDSTCVELVDELCAATCSANPPSAILDSYCDDWFAGQTDPNCAEADLSLGASCKDPTGGNTVIPICNHGQTDYPAGAEVAYFLNTPIPGGGSCGSSAGADGICTLTAPVPSGTCRGVECPGLNGKVASYVVNPGGANECVCLDNWGETSAAPPACVTNQSCWNRTGGGTSSAENVFAVFDTNIVSTGGGGWTTSSTPTPYTGALRSLMAIMAINDPKISLSMELSRAGIGEPWANDGCSSKGGCFDYAAQCGNPIAGPVISTNRGYWGAYLADGGVPSGGKLGALYSQASNFYSKSAGKPNLDVAMYGALMALRNQALKSPDQRQALVLITNGANFSASTCAGTFGGNPAVYGDYLRVLADRFYRNFGIYTHVVLTTDATAAGKTAADSIAAAGGTSAAVSIQSNDTGFSDIKNRLETEGLAITPPQRYTLSDLGPTADTDLTQVTRVDATGAAVGLTRVSSSLGAACNNDPDEMAFLLDDDANPTEVILCDSTYAWLTAHPGARIIVDVLCAGVPKATKTERVRHFEGKCADVGSKVVWDYLAFQAVTPGASTVELHVRRGVTGANDVVAWSSWEDAGTVGVGHPAYDAATGVTDCYYGSSCMVELYDLLGKGQGVGSDVLEVSATLIPSGNDTPSVQSLRVNYSCQDAE